MSNDSAYLRNRCDDRETWPERRTRITRLRFKVRDRRPLEAAFAEALWDEYLESHAGNERAALGELLGAAIERGLLREEGRRW